MITQSGVVVKQDPYPSHSVSSSLFPLLSTLYRLSIVRLRLGGESSPDSTRRRTPVRARCVGRGTWPEIRVGVESTKEGGSGVGRRTEEMEVGETHVTFLNPVTQGQRRPRVGTALELVRWDDRTYHQRKIHFLPWIDIYEIPGRTQTQELASEYHDHLKSRDYNLNQVPWEVFLDRIIF